MLVSCAAAQEAGFFNNLIRSLQNIIDSLFGGSQTPPQTTTTVFACNPPYIVRGSDCCLDRNENQVCDEDETTTTVKQTTTTEKTQTTEKPTTTTAKPTTTIKPTTTTTTIYIECHDSSDCGVKKTELVCYNNDVYEQTSTPICYRKGTPDSECKMLTSGITRANQLLPPKIDCDPGFCWQGACVNEKPTTTTTTQGSSTTNPSPTTTQAPTPTTTLPASFTPSCGDGILSWHGSTPKGTEECEQGVVPCPSGLTCSDCVCTGCGNGKLEAGEECDPNNKMMQVNGEDLWSGTAYGCQDQYEYCDTNCECTSTYQCGQSLYDSDDCDNECSDCETCQQYPGMPCYQCVKDCSLLGGDWSSSVSCDGSHEELAEHPNCLGCYTCEEVCPENLGYYLTEGCGAECVTCDCVKIGSGEYADCYHCLPDQDSDCVVDDQDNCPDTYNPNQGDEDGDTIGDCCDETPIDCQQHCANAGWIDGGNYVAKNTCSQPNVNGGQCTVTCTYAYSFKWSWSNKECCCQSHYIENCPGHPDNCPNCPNPNTVCPQNRPNNPPQPLGDC
ncbi:MAG: hypothetical protein GF334_13365 [Candidatus Altiarchaeales archaeon]|nr:hypothetical protein [Candidatus Altiarchaeales archaeon]